MCPLCLLCKHKDVTFALASTSKLSFSPISSFILTVYVFMQRFGRLSMPANPQSSLQTRQSNIMAHITQSVGRKVQREWHIRKRSLHEKIHVNRLGKLKT